jgi:hypothetical protein
MVHCHKQCLTVSLTGMCFFCSSVTYLTEEMWMTMMIFPPDKLCLHHQLVLRGDMALYIRALFITIHHSHSLIGFQQLTQSVISWPVVRCRPRSASYRTSVHNNISVTIGADDGIEWYNAHGATCDTPCK